ncbi:vacuolar membrane PQ loop repeat protein [Pyronema omphalodes]|nr:vacuolar membrane PQ loop repeat protein [Pyronema omphalodes]
MVGLFARSTLALSSSSLGTANAGSELTVSEALSGIAGSISLVSWIVLLLPQLIENYKNGRADALSLAFIAAWFLGDVANLIGAIWGNLLPTVIAIAIYFCFSDMLLLGQCLYYNSLTSKENSASPSSSPIDTPQITIRRPTQDLSSEQDPLIPDYERRRNSAASRRSSIILERQRKDSLSLALKDTTNTKLSPATKEVLSILGVIAAGTVGWALAYYSGAWSVKDDPESGREMPMGAKLLGYLSAVLYLAARVPQIVKNARERSCEGLSRLFFLLSLLGNITYGAGILLHSSEKEYVMDNLPWLMGSLGTMAEDIIIFIQFRIYSKHNQQNQQNHNHHNQQNHNQHNHHNHDHDHRILQEYEA